MFFLSFSKKHYIYTYTNNQKVGISLNPKNKMANQKQTLEVVRNIITQIDDQIRRANNLILMYEIGKGSIVVNDMSKEEREIRLDETETWKYNLEKLKEYCIYKA